MGSLNLVKINEALCISYTRVALNDNIISFWDGLF